MHFIFWINPHTGMEDWIQLPEQASEVILVSLRYPDGF